MSNDLLSLQKDIKALHRQSVFSLVGTLGIFIFGLFSVLFLLAEQWFLVAFPLLLLLFSIVLLLIKRKEKRTTPYRIKPGQRIVYDDMIQHLKSLTLEDDTYEISAEQSMFKIKKHLDYRILVSYINSFNKKDYDSFKRSANKKFNAKYHPGNWAPMDTVRHMMRLNIICVDEMNEALEKYISQNAAHLLRRNEGIINLAICNDTIFVPPINGAVDLQEVERYKKSVMFVLDMFGAYT